MSYSPAQNPREGFEFCFTNIPSPKETVFTRLLLVKGTLRRKDAGESPRAPTGVLTVSCSRRSGFGSQRWQINKGYFKALVPLTPGSNNIDFHWKITGEVHKGRESLTLIYDRSEEVPPLRLVILAAFDSPLWDDPDATPGNRHPVEVQRVRSQVQRRQEADFIPRKDPALIDWPPGLRQRSSQPGGLREVKRRFALQAYLWQAIHAEQMHVRGLQRRAFQLDDKESDPTPGLSSPEHRSLELLPIVHLLKSRYTLQDMLDPERPQDERHAVQHGNMHRIVEDALERDFRELRSSPFAVLILDTAYDSRAGILRGHSEVGVGQPHGQLTFGSMGSFWLWAAPSSLSDVAEAFLNTQLTNIDFRNNFLVGCRTAWQTLSAGSAAFLRQILRAMHKRNRPTEHQERGPLAFNRAFMTIEPEASQNDTADWDALPEYSDTRFCINLTDAHRARWHPCLAIPSDDIQPAATQDIPNLVYPTWTPTFDGVRVSCPGGIALIEVKRDGLNRVWLRQDWQMPLQQATINQADLSAFVGFPVMESGAEVALIAWTCNVHVQDLDDFRHEGYARTVDLAGVDPSCRSVIRSPPLGRYARNDAMTLTLRHERDNSTRSPLARIEIFYNEVHGVTGLKFHHTSSKIDVLGPCDASIFASERFGMQVRQGDRIASFKIRCGFWIDAIDVVLTSGRRSGMKGNLKGGGVRILEPIDNGNIVGLHITGADRLDTLAMYTAISRP